MQTKSFSQIMSDGYEIFINRWAPDTDEQIKGVVQLHHGLSEHSMRYDRLGSILAENGFVLNAYDMRGHGKSAENSINKKTGIFGKIADKDGFNRAVKDLYEITNAVKKIYHDKKIILFGHSFGSFVSQSYIEQFGNTIDGVILCGTSGPKTHFVLVGNIISKLSKVIKGKDYTSPFFEKVAFGNYNNKVINPKTSMDWICSNEMTVSMYEMDNWCGFPLTTSFYCDMTNGLLQIHKRKNIKKIPNNLPVFFIYGSEDPVGDYGKTVTKLFNIYKNMGIQRVEIKSYEGYRHEILNENDCEVVEKDIISWISSL